MISVLFLDDMEWRHEQFSKIADYIPDIWIRKVYTATAAIAALNEDYYNQVFLDHDLASEDATTGMTVVEHILTMVNPPHTVFVHSCNPPAAQMMVNKLETHQAGIWVRRLAFPELMNRMHQIVWSLTGR